MRDSVHCKIRAGALVGVVDFLADERCCVDVHSAFESAGDRHHDDLSGAYELTHSAYAVVIHDTRSSQSGSPCVEQSGGRGVRREGVGGVDVVVHKYSALRSLYLSAAYLFHDLAESFKTFVRAYVGSRNSRDKFVCFHYFPPLFIKDINVNGSLVLFRTYMRTLCGILLSSPALCRSRGRSFSF